MGQELMCRSSDVGRCCTLAVVPKCCYWTNAVRFYSSSATIVLPSFKSFMQSVIIRLYIPPHYNCDITLRYYSCSTEAVPLCYSRTSGVPSFNYFFLPSVVSLPPPCYRKKSSNNSIGVSNSFPINGPLMRSSLCHSPRLRPRLRRPPI